MGGGGAHLHAGHGGLDSARAAMAKLVGKSLAAGPSTSINVALALPCLPGPSADVLVWGAMSGCRR